MFKRKTQQDAARRRRRLLRLFKRLELVEILFVCAAGLVVEQGRFALCSNPAIP